VELEDYIVGLLTPTQILLSNLIRVTAEFESSPQTVVLVAELA
jgi:hypothetical protein